MLFLDTFFYLLLDLADDFFFSSFFRKVGGVATPGMVGEKKMEGGEVEKGKKRGGADKAPKNGGQKRIYDRLVAECGFTGGETTGQAAGKRAS